MNATLRQGGRGLGPRRVITLAVPRLVLFTLLWLVLTDVDLEAWYLGVLFIVAGVASSLLLRPDHDWRLTLGGSARFVPFFLRQSLVGGTDVALRAVRPAMPLEPELVEYRSRLAENGPRVFMVSLISLLPGTLSADLEDRHLQIHSLMGGQPAIDNVRELEVRVADLFGVQLESDGAGEEESKDA